MTRYIDCFTSGLIGFVLVLLTLCAPTTVQGQWGDETEFESINLTSIGFFAGWMSDQRMRQNISFNINYVQPIREDSRILLGFDSYLGRIENLGYQALGATVGSVLAGRAGRGLWVRGSLLYAQQQNDFSAFFQDIRPGFAYYTSLGYSFRLGQTIPPASLALVYANIFVERVHRPVGLQLSIFY